MDSIETASPLVLIALGLLFWGLLIGSIWLWVRHLSGSSERLPGEPMGDGVWALSWVNFAIFIGATALLIWFFQNLAVSLVRFQSEDGVFDPEVMGMKEVVFFGLAIQLPLAIAVLAGRAAFPDHFQFRLRERVYSFGVVVKCALGRLVRWLPVILAVSAGWVALLGVFTKLGWIAEPEPQLVVLQFLKGGEPLVMLAFIGMAVIVAPIAEEIFFRGALYRFFKGKGGVVFASVLSAFLFALVHANLHSFVGLFLVGLLLAKIYEDTRDIWVPILFHAAFNAFSLLLLALSSRVSGIE